MLFKRVFGFSVFIYCFISFFCLVFAFSVEVEEGENIFLQNNFYDLDDISEVENEGNLLVDKVFNRFKQQQESEEELIPVSLIYGNSDFYDFARAERKLVFQNLSKDLKRVDDLVFEAYNRIEFTEEMDYDKSSKQFFNVLSVDEKNFLNRTSFEVDRRKDLMKKKLSYLQNSFFEISYNETIEVVSECGLSVNSSSFDYGAGFMYLPLSCIRKLKNISGIVGVYKEEGDSLHLDHSVDAINADDFWDAGYKGGNFDIGVVEYWFCY